MLNTRQFVMRHLFLLLTLSGMPIIANAVTLQVEAKAATEQLARREALAALADSILVDVQSEIYSRRDNKGKKEEEVRFSSRSDIPLIGVDIKLRQSGDEIVCEAKLDSRKSLPLYSKRLNELAMEISGLDQRIAKVTGSNDKYGLLTQSLTVIEQYEKYRVVSELLGENQLAAAPHSRIDTEAQLRDLEKSAATIELAAKILAKGLKAEDLYIYPAVPNGSHEVTPFARVMRDRLAEKLTTVESLDKAQTFLKGEYEILDNSIQLTYRLLDNSGNTLETRVVTLAPAAYAGLQVKPVTLDFDKLLHEGLAVSNDFRVQVSTNRGNEEVLFNEKDEVELLVKINRPGYFYVVGHVVKKSENSSYLLELSHLDNDRRFIRYVNADDANKWLSIGKFEVSAPFGVESLQLIASKDDPIDRLPTHLLDSKSELYVTAGNAQQGIVKTRALKPKHTEGDNAYQGEAVLMFTTMQKQGK